MRPFASTMSLLGTTAAALLLATAASGQLVVGTTLSIATGPSPSGAAIGDFNGDGVTDLAVTIDAPDRIQFLIGNGLGAYAAGPVIALGAGTGAGDILAADIDNDGDADLAVCLKNLGSVRIFRNNGGGAFVVVGTFATGDDCQGLDAADFDLDNDLDFAVANSKDDTSSVLRNDGASFTVATFASGLDPRGAAFGDFDSDGDLDLAVSSHDDRTVRVFRFNGGLTFTPMATLNVPVTVRPSGIDVGDLNGDGLADIAVATSGNTAAFATVFFRTRGTFSVATNFATLGLDTNNIVLADVDCDSDLDMAVLNPTSNTMSILANNGTGAFVATTFATGTDPTAIAASDLNADGDNDIMVTNKASATVTVFENACAIAPVCGNGICEAGEDPNCIDCQPPQPADLNADGVVNANDLAILLGSWGSLAGDVNGDGTTDGTDLALLLGAWS